MTVARTRAAARPGVLCNMSARPRTAVSRTIPVLRNRWVLFAGPNTRPRLDTDVLARLDEQWRSIGMTGAALLHPVTGDLTQHVVPTACPDRQLTLNVLLRARGSLLLATMPLLDDPDAVVGVRMATDDPRLVAHGLGQSGR